MKFSKIKLRNICLSIVTGMIVPSVGCLILTSLSSLLKLTTWSVSFFIVLNIFVVSLIGGITGIIMERFVGSKKGVSSSIFRLALALVFVQVSTQLFFALLSRYKPPMSEFIESLLEHKLTALGLLLSMVVTQSQLSAMTNKEADSDKSNQTMMNGKANDDKPDRPSV